MTAPPIHPPATPDPRTLRPRLAHLPAAGREALRRIRRAVRRRLSPLEDRPSLGVLYPRGDEDPDGGWSFHDENWVRVIHRFEHRRLLRQGLALVVRDNPQEMSNEVVCGSDGSITADVPARTQQEWVWLHLDPGENNWRDFRWEFTVRRDTDFRELQFGFRYIDFYNRYRFRHEAGHLHFDMVVNGAFWNSIHRVPFKMELGCDYHWRIEARDNRFILAIDGQVFLDEMDRHRRFPRGSIAVIFWEDDGRTPIRASVTRHSVVEI